MKTIALIFAFCAALLSTAQWSTNADVKSLCGSVHEGPDARSFFDVACTRISGSSLITTLSANDDVVIAQIDNDMGQHIHMELIMIRSADRVNYCIQDIKVNGVSMQRWAETADAAKLEQVQASISAISGLLIVTMKGTP